jgi:HD-GYP domain-containing protein (c-di-GMP phosphodiesterase class II)
MMDERHLAALDEVLRRFSAAMKAVHLYSPDHPLVERATIQLADVFDRLLAEQTEVVIGIVDGHLVVDGQPVLGTPGVGEVLDRFGAVGIDRLTIRRGVTAPELGDFVRRLPPAAAHKYTGDTPGIDPTEHISPSRLRVQRRTETAPHDVHAVRRAYADAVARVEQMWAQTVSEGKADPAVASEIVDGLAELVGQNRRAMVALTALNQYDNYTFTHMVNVGILTMAQARCLGIEGAALRHFGMAGLMHDIGKIKVPPEIITKPAKLTDAEFAIMKRHPMDGAEILRRQVEMPPLVAVVAFEHHLRIDGTGYPDGVRRDSLNLATQLCAIADIYDAMRSQRAYQQAFPTERILVVLQQNDGTRFDQRLVRRFTQLMGIYPPGNLVKLDTGAIAVVLRVHAPDPAKPAVRVIIGPDGNRLTTPYDIALWQHDSPAGPPPRIVTPVSPADVAIDPLPYLDETAA